MTEEELRRRGYYLFGIDQNRFVQVRELATDKVILIGQGEANALKKAERYFFEIDAGMQQFAQVDDGDEPERCYNVELTMIVTVRAVGHEDAEERAVSEAAAKLDSQGIGCLIVQPAEETECDA